MNYRYSNETYGADQSTVSNTTDQVNSYTSENEGQSQVSGLVLIQGFVCPFVLVGNILIIIVIRKCTGMKYTTRLLICHLSVADFLMGAGMLTRVFFIVYGEDGLTKTRCVLLQSVVVLCTGCSMTGILLMCLDSYMAFQNSTPLTDGSWCSRRVYTWLIPWLGGRSVALCWTLWGGYTFWITISTLRNSIVAAVCYLPGGYFKKLHMVLLPMLYFIQLLLVSYFQIKTLRTARRHISRLDCMDRMAGRSQPMPSIRESSNEPSETSKTFVKKTTHAKRSPVLTRADQSVSSETTTLEKSTSERTASGGHYNMSRGRRWSQISLWRRRRIITLCQKALQKRRLTRLDNMSRMVGLVLALYFLCWFPTMFGLLLFCICERGCNVQGHILVYSANLFLLGSGLNLPIFYFKSREFRKVLKGLICCRRCTRRVQPYSR